MDERSILELGGLILAGSGVALIATFRANPLLRGLNWMGAALLVGGCAAAVLLLSLRQAMLEPLGNLLLLLAFLLGNRATRLCVTDREQSNRTDLLLAALQALCAVPIWLRVIPVSVSNLILCALLAVALTRTAGTLGRSAVGRARPTALFAQRLLLLMVGADVLRGAALACGWLGSPARADFADALTYSVFIAGAVAFGFSFFARTTLRLTVELEHMASTDPLTRVSNRRVFLQWCEKEEARSRVSGIPFSLLLVDFDYFKNINDTYGHQAGDAVLCAAVEQIQNAIRGVDLLCRWGGEEFAILLPHASSEASLIVAERIRHNMRNVRPELQATMPMPTSPAGRPEPAAVAAAQPLTVSIGATSWSGVADRLDAMVQRADSALYAAKAAGRNRVVVLSHIEAPDHPRSATPLSLQSQVS